MVARGMATAVDDIICVPEANGGTLAVRYGLPPSASLIIDE